MRPLKLFIFFLVFLLGINLSRPSAAILGEFSLKKEAELGQKFKKLLRSRLPLIEDPEITSYVRGMVAKLAKEAPYYPFKIEVDVVENNSLNAFATLAGYIVVYSGLIMNVQSDSELAGVLAHELAHLTQRHVAKNIEQSQLVSLGSLATLLAGVFLGKGEMGEAMVIGSVAGAQSLMLKYTRENEREADQVGFNYLVKSGYNPWGMVQVFELIRKKRWLSGSSIPSYLYTHPEVNERIGYLEDRLKRANIPLNLQKSEQLKLVQTLLWAKYTDPNLALSFFKGEDCYSLLGKAIALRRLNRFKEALTYFEKLKKCPNNSVFKREIGLFYYRLGKIDLALNNLQQAVLLNPKDTLALFYYARAMAEKGEKTALKYFQEALEKMPYSPEIREELGIFYGKQGNFFQAHLNLAYAYLLKKEEGKFKFHYQKARELALSEQEKKLWEQLKKEYQERKQL